MGPIRRVLAGAAALALSGCWLQTGYGPTHQSSNPFQTGLTAGNVASLAPVWSTPVPNEFGAEPLVDGSAVYTAGFEGVDTFVVTALGRGSGTPLWHHDVPAEPGVPRSALGTLVRAGPDQVLVAVPGAAGGPVILALDPDTGATQATLPVPGLTDPSWVIADDSVIAYLAATDLTSPQPVANIVVRDRATLALRWSSVPPPDIQSMPSPTLISQGRLYAQSLAGGRPSIVAYALDGCGAAVCDPLFTVPVPQPSTTNPSHSASLLAATDDGHLLVRLDTGPDTNRLLGISVTEGTLFFSQTGAGISAYAPT